MKARIGAGLVATLAVLLTTASTATATPPPGWHEKPRSLHLAFHMRTSGYLMSLETTGHRQVSLSLGKGNVFVTYTTAGQVSRNGIEADFGALGEIAVDFSGRPTRFAAPRGLGFLPPGAFPDRECRGRRPQQETGTFHGTIRFEGENGFAQIDTDRAKGTMRRTYRRLCKGGPPRGLLAAGLERASASAAGRSKLSDIHMNILIAGGEQGGREVLFETFGFSGSSGDPLLDGLSQALGPLAIVSTTEHREDVLIQRLGLASGDEGSLIVSPPKRKRITATVAFPKPFEGTAEYEHTPGSPPSWVGSLVARLPGAGAVPLTDAGFKTLFCRLSLLEDETGKRCLKEAEATFPGARSARLLMR